MLYFLLWPIVAIWPHSSGSTLARVMAYCRIAPSLYFNWCWLITKNYQRHSSENNFAKDISDTNELNPKLQKKFFRNIFLHLKKAVPSTKTKLFMDKNIQGMTYSDSKINGANMGPTWGRQDPGGPHVILLSGYVKHSCHRCACRWPYPALIARFMGPIWGPYGADRTQVGPMLAPWILQSGWGFSYGAYLLVVFTHWRPTVCIWLPEPAHDRG